MITPQAIKDQEFQLKFRGCDPIEVKSYLELLAEDFFELHEVQRKQATELEELRDELTNVCEERDSLSAEVNGNRDNAESVQLKVEEGYRYKDERIAALTAELTAITEEKASVVDDLQQLREDVSDLEKREESVQELLVAEQGETGKLTDKISLLEEQLEDLKREGVDFKSTILVAQKFSEELKAHAQIEADGLLAAAQLESDEFRVLADEEIHDLSSQIETLTRTRNEVRDELTGKLEDVLNSLKVLDVENETIALDEEDEQ